MQYVGQFLYWFMIICAIVLAIKGLFILCAKRPVYPGDVFKEIKVTNSRKYNMLNGLLLIVLGIVFVSVALAFRYSSVNLSVILLIGAYIVAELDKRVKNKYLVQCTVGI